VDDGWPAVAALRVSRPYQTALRHVWNDAMRDPILSGPFSRCVRMESTYLRSAVLGYHVRCLRARDVGRARAAFEDPCCDATDENIVARLGYLCARVKLDLFAAPLAQILAGVL